MSFYELAAGSPTPPGYLGTVCPVRGTLLVSQGDQAERVAKLRHDWQLAKTCESCNLHEGRDRAAYGKGNPLADVFLVGDAPGEEEDRQGLPFVGRAGQVLDQAATVAEVDLSTWYVSNAVKCRPPEDRDPYPHESESCHSFLQYQLLLVRPLVVVLAGRVACQTLDPTILSVTRERGQVAPFVVPAAHYTNRAGEHTLPALAASRVVTLHPAFVLRNPQALPQLVADLRTAQGATSSA